MSKTVQHSETIRPFILPLPVIKQIKIKSVSKGGVCEFIFKARLTGLKILNFFQEHNVWVILALPNQTDMKIANDQFNWFPTEIMVG